MSYLSESNEMSVDGLEVQAYLTLLSLALLSFIDVAFFTKGR